jgi:ribulose-5-phosphate 4-epimerase/fuculose-1-phosphate aldolase
MPEPPTTPLPDSATTVIDAPTGSLSALVGAGAGAAARSFAVAGAADERLAHFVEQLSTAFEGEGFEPAGRAADADFVINLIDPAHPRPFRRGSRGTFVAALALLPSAPADGLRETYPLLVRALANIVLCYIPGTGVSFTTMERGHYIVSAPDDAHLARMVADRLLPLARARLVIDNEFLRDLEPELWAGDACTAQIAAAGRRLDRLGLLPTPFPMEELVDERDLRHIRRLYGIGGLSYGNLSVRKDATRFWMSASGVDKSMLSEPGRDILLVSGFDAASSRMLLSVPPAAVPRRVSVDAIEHWVIYREHPGIGAILHVHAWIDGITATEINFPCGTAELATAVATLIAGEPDPDHAVIGLRNHGVTATGESLDEILERVEPRLLRQVPMS